MTGLHEIREEWFNAISNAKQLSNSQESLRNFEHLGTEPAARASFFAAMAEVVSKLGLSNPHEKSALSIEPTHPIHPTRISEEVDRLGINSILPKCYKESKLSLVSLAMIEHYSPASDAKPMRAGGFRDPLYLLDPLYGFVFLPRKGKIGNHCLAIDIWSSHLNSMPLQLAQSLWKNRSDNMLSGGAFAGRLLFKDLVSQETDPRKLSLTPEITVNTEKEFLHLVNSLKNAASKHSGVQIWFRGQNKEYLTPDRTQLAKIGIAPYSNIRESDFTPSLYRSYDKFFESSDGYEKMVIELADWVYCAKSLVAENYQAVTSSQAEGAAKLSPQGIGSYQNGLILQQYGAPSSYLDITKDPLVAAWFATRRCRSEESGTMTFEDYSWGGSNSEKWPTVYIFPLVKGLHPFMDLELMLPENIALRPSRQKCGLLGGAGNLARNYCARYLGLKIRLGPNFRLSSPLHERELFPSVSEDSTLKSLKENGLADSTRSFRLSELSSN